MEYSVLKRFKPHRLAFLVIIAIVSILLARVLPLVQLAENLFYDIRITLLSERSEDAQKILLVGITEETLATMPYRSPIDRAFLSELVMEIESKGASSIGLDILFDQPTEAVKDASLRALLNSMQIPLVVASAGLDNYLLPQQDKFLSFFTENLSRGNATVFRDALDGVVRTLPLRIGVHEEYGLAAQVAHVNGFPLPEDNLLHIDYRRSHIDERSLFPMYPAETVGLLPDIWFQDKIVLVGAELQLDDRHATPHSRVLGLERGVPGLQIQAQALSQLIENRSLHVPLLSWVFVLCLICAILGQVTSGAKNVILYQCLLLISFLILLWTSASIVFTVNRVMIEVMAPSIALLLSSMLTMLRQWQSESKNRRFIQSAFSKYLSPEYVNQLVANPDLLKAGGERRELTFLFTDLADFTPLTESMQAEELMALLNDYLDGACEIVTRHRGMVANIVGDALYVIFNAPLDDPEHASNAIAAAVELDRFCCDFQLAKQAEGIDLNVTRIGINTGSGVIGNVGGSRRLEYTAMGDGTNIAARLESVNKHIGTRICVSESTVEQSYGVGFRPVGCLVLKGKTVGVKTYTPVLDESADFVKAYTAAYQSLSASDAAAINQFRELAKKHPDDALVSLHNSRLAGGASDDLIIMDEK